MGFAGPIPAFALAAQHFNDPDKEAARPSLATLCQLLGIARMGEALEGVIWSLSSLRFVALCEGANDNKKLCPPIEPLPP